jgi:ankyrin repeat protein
MNKNQHDSFAGFDKRLKKLLQALIQDKPETTISTEIEQMKASDGDINALIANNIGTVLHIATQKRESKIVELLLASGASTNEVILPERYTPLHIAAIHQKSETFKLLVRHGALLYTPDKFDLTPVDYAAITGNIGLCHWLKEQSAQLTQKGRKLAIQKGFEPCTLLLGEPQKIYK